MGQNGRINMKVNPRELREKGIEYCKKHEGSAGHLCERCALCDHSMCITRLGTISLADADMDFMAFMKDFYKMVEIINGEEAADE